MSGDRPTVALNMIVKDEEKNLPNALLSAISSGIFDELVVVDTGSTDDTVSIALHYGCSVYLHKWDDDFAAARNEAIIHTQSDWIMVLDADDRLLDLGAHTIQQAIEGKLNEPNGPENTYGYAFNIQERNLDGANRGTARGSVRLFRNSHQMRYRYPVHEVVRPEPQGPLQKACLISGGPHIAHYGYDPSILIHKDKDARNLRLLYKRLEQYPNDLIGTYYVARQHRWMFRDVEAMEWARKTMSHPDVVTLAPDHLKELFLWIKEGKTPRPVPDWITLVSRGPLELLSSVDTSNAVRV